MIHFYLHILVLNISKKLTKKKKKILYVDGSKKKMKKLLQKIFTQKIKKLKPYEIVDNINKSMKDYYTKKEKNSSFSEIQDDDENTEKENKSFIL